MKTEHNMDPKQSGIKILRKENICNFILCFFFTYFCSVLFYVETVNKKKKSSMYKYNKVKYKKVATYRCVNIVVLRI